MMTNAIISCASCGAAVSGRFCSHCGAARTASACHACGHAVAPGAKFCPACGQGLAPSAAVMGSKAERTPWLIAGAALVALMAVLLSMLARSPQTMTGQSTEVGGMAAPPDISAMSPRERFDRLYNRVMQAAQSGDEATVSRFTPMALMAYAQLDSVDADARYHAALLQVHSGDVAGPLALADTILARHPGHLFGYVIRGTVARWRKDDAALRQAYADFLRHDDTERKAARSEYADHRASLDEFRQQAQRDGAKGPGT